MNGTKTGTVTKAKITTKTITTTTIARNARHCETPCPFASLCVEPCLLTAGFNTAGLAQYPWRLVANPQIKI
jgi:hypothetical protein